MKIAKMDGMDKVETQVLRDIVEESKQVADWLRELERYKELEEQGRLIVLPGDARYQIVSYGAGAGKTIKKVLVGDPLVLVVVLRQLLETVICESVGKADRQALARAVYEQVCENILYYEVMGK